MKRILTTLFILSISVLPVRAQWSPGGTASGIYDLAQDTWQAITCSVVASFTSGITASNITIEGGTASINSSGFAVFDDGASVGDTWYVPSGGGNVGIGTASPMGLLDVRGTVLIGVDGTGHDVKFFGATASASALWDESADSFILTGGATGTEPLLVIDGGASHADHRIETRYNTTPNFAVTFDGRVGAGTASPQATAALHALYSSNATWFSIIQNDFEGNAARAAFQAQSNANTATLYVHDDAYTTSNQYVADSALLEADGVTQLGFSTTGASVPFVWYSNAAEVMRLNSGNLGIGTASLGWQAAWTGVNVGGNGTLWGITAATAGNEFDVGQNVHYDTDGSHEYISTDEASRYKQTAGTHVFEVAPSGTAGNDITFVQAFQTIGTTAGSIVLDLVTTGNRIDFNTANTSSVRADADDGLVLEVGAADDYVFGKGAAVFSEGLTVPSITYAGSPLVAFSGSGSTATWNKTDGGAGYTMMTIGQDGASRLVLGAASFTNPAGITSKPLLDMEGTAPSIHFEDTDDEQFAIVVDGDKLETFQGVNTVSVFTAGDTWQFNADSFVINNGTSTEVYDFLIEGGGGAWSGIDAGDVGVSGSSSPSLKRNISPLTTAEIDHLAEVFRDSISVKQYNWRVSTFYDSAKVRRAEADTLNIPDRVYFAGEAIAHSRDRDVAVEIVPAHNDTVQWQESALLDSVIGDTTGYSDWLPDMRMEVEALLDSVTGDTTGYDTSYVAYLTKQFEEITPVAADTTWEFVPGEASRAERDSLLSAITAETTEAIETVRNRVQRKANRKAAIDKIGLMAPDARRISRIVAPNDAPAGKLSTAHINAAQIALIQRLLQIVEDQEARITALESLH